MEYDNADHRLRYRKPHLHKDRMYLHPAFENMAQ